MITPFHYMMPARLAGFEPTANHLEGDCSIH
jgi:hypothetical protein